MSGILPANIEERFARRIKDLCGPLEPRLPDVVERQDRIPGIRAALFDVYGTLFVSGSGDVGTAAAAASEQAMREAIASAGLETTDDVAPDALRMFHEEIRSVHERGKADGIAYPEVDIRRIWERVLVALNRDERVEIDHAYEKILQLAIEYECRVNPVWPMPGMLEVLSVLRSRDIRLGIVSNAQFFTPLLFPALAGRSHLEFGFQPDLCAWSFEYLEAKPSPALFAQVLRELEREGIQPSECVYIGNDMLNDVLTGSQAGCRTVLFAGDQRSIRMREDDPRCEGLQPDAVVTSLGQLPDLIRNGGG